MDSSSATRHLLKYASYHRDRRNIATHFIGIPLIVFAIGVLLGHVRFTLGNLGVSPAGLLWIVSTTWYLSLGKLVLGLSVGVVNGLLFALGAPVGEGAQWLTWGLSSFVVGWILQFVGHFYEGMKPAFVDDLTGLLVGPMFVVSEALFALGWGRALRVHNERAVGPIVARRSH